MWNSRCASCSRIDAPAGKGAMRRVPFRARPPWIGGDLQTVRNFLRRPSPGFEDAPGETLTFDMADGTGDRLTGTLHRGGDPAAPLVVVVHGLTGCEGSFHVLTSARALLDRGWSALRLNLRGAGPDAGRCAEQYHAGRSGDLARVFAALAPDWRARGLAAIGYSLGGNILLKYLGEAGAAAPLFAAAAVSAPIDLAATARHFHRPRNRLYLGYLLRRLKRDVALSRGGLPPALTQGAAAARDIVEFDERFVAPRYGFASAADYYARSSAQGYFGGVAVPSLLIQARDDSWVPAAPFAAVNWPDYPRLQPLLFAGGGHVGFHEAGHRLPAHDRAIRDFLAARRPAQPALSALAAATAK
jgi:hypothetical protein